MTTEEIKKNAPIGATHYSKNPIGLLYIKYVNGSPFYTHSDRVNWKKMNPNYDDIKPL